MEWIIVGVIILILFLLFLGLFFGSSGAINIAKEEREEIEKETPEQITKQVEEIEKENGAAEEEEFSSHG